MKKWLIGAAIGLVSFVQSAQAENWKITVLDWPPFTNPTMPEQGAGMAVIKKAMEAHGVTVEPVWLPWARAIEVAKTDKDVVGYYPAWPGDVVEGFFASQALFESPIAMIENSEKPIVWDKVEDLSKYAMVYVKDYGYPKPLMDGAKSGGFKVSYLNTDLAQIRALAGGRGDTGPIDANVFAYTMATDESLKEFRGKVRLNSKNISVEKLLLAFSDRPENKARAELLATAMKNTDGNKIIKDYMAANGLELTQ